MTQSFTGRKRVRKHFGRIAEIAPIPDLIDVQRTSYEGFLQHDVPAEEREQSGLQEVLSTVFPIRDFAGKAQLEFTRYEFEEPKYDVEECQQRGMTYAAPLRVTLRLVVWDIDAETGARSVRDIKEQDVYMGDMPLMTDNGTFIINGTERVIVSQMHRSPGVFFDHDRGKTHASGKLLFSARVIPYRGSWLDFEFDAKDLVYVRIDRRRKLPLTTFLLALEAGTEAARAEAEARGGELDPDLVEGMSAEEILSEFYDQVVFRRDRKDEKSWDTPIDFERLQGQRLLEALRDARSGEIVAEAGSNMTRRRIEALRSDGVREQRVAEDQLIGRSLAVDHVDPKTGHIYAEAGARVDEDLLAAFAEARVNEVVTLAIDNVTVGSHVLDTLLADRNKDREDALADIYRVMRPGEPPTPEGTRTLFNGLFFDDERYDLSAVGRVKMNARLGQESGGGEEGLPRVLTKRDILEILKTLVGLRDGRGEVDDIDHLGNRRVRSVGELMENQYRIGLLRMERAIRERMSTIDVDSVMPQDLINAKPAAAAVREFFGSSQLSQFMDQTNPLSEVTHKRRLSALGPGGLTRERAGFEVRDVHPTHYGRICPVETPEGPNIGLINSLATYARVNQYGFIETPYRPVEEGVALPEIVYMTAIDEGRYTIAQANAPLDAGGRFTQNLVSVRRGNDFAVAPPDQVDYMDVSPKQLVSVAAALIPFLENDDANRALMGSNMQRQAVPLVRSEAPLVGTGMEAAVARDSGASVTARRTGTVDQVDATRIVVRADAGEISEDTGVDIYNLRKFQRSNQSTCINQRPLVKVGDKVSRGDIIADGPSTELGELALGRNVLCAFMPWNGYNFEDSLVISERIARDDVFTSIHIEEYEIKARDTKLGPEEITRDIPNVAEDALRNLDEAGIVYIGAEVQPGDILVGKVTPKGESPITPEEKLLRAIFGEKASDFRDTSLKLPPGAAGTVVDVRVFLRRGVDKDERARAIDQFEIERLAKDRDDERKILTRNFEVRLHELLTGRTARSGPGVGKDARLTKALLDGMTTADRRRIVLQNDAAMRDVQTLCGRYDESVAALDDRFENKVEKLERGDELPPGVMKLVKVFVAVKRKLQPGDKMAGRHGNKGVISRVVPIEDMPYTEDGTPVDLVLNPLGVPSRMNVGQILETHLGAACRGLGRRIEEMLEKVNESAGAMEGLRDHLRGLYGAERYGAEVEPLDDAELLELSHNLASGVPIATPVFDEAREDEIDAMLESAGIPSTGQVTLIDGRSGEPFDRPVTVGYIYMLKLHHLVDDKIHARSIGPYSLVTQQPLGGKAHFGGQRFGEMEVWALEAYGAAYTLQEILTAKSDDVSGRTKVYEAVVRGEDKFEVGIPESFNVLVKELRSLGLNVDLHEEQP